MHHELLNYIDQFDHKESVLSFLISLREELNWKINIDDRDLFKLIKDRIITKDYIKQQFILLIPIYKSDEGTIDLPETTMRFIDNDIDTYRILFKGVRVGNMGNKKNCIDLMNKFLIEHPNYTVNDIIGASLYYIQNTDYQYIMNAENFIYKLDDKGNYTSKLETVLEEYILSAKESNLL